METTPLYEFENIPNGVIDWTAILNRNFSKIDNAIHSAVLITAGQALTARNCIYLKSDGLWYKAQANGTLQPALAIVQVSVSLGATARAIRHGLYETLSSGGTLVPGQPIYLSPTTLGGWTQTKPASNIQIIGVALNTEDAFIHMNGIVL